MYHHDLIQKKLIERHKDSRPIRVAVLGAGWFSSGLIEEMFRWPGMTPKIIFSRDPNKAVNILRSLGVNPGDIALISSSENLRNTSLANRFWVSSRFELLDELKSIDVVFDGTGDLLTGARAAIASINNGIHFVAISSELDSTVGCVLSQMAREKGVVYSNCDGDQPGVLARMIREVRAYGFEILVAGNCKGFMDVHKTPEDIKPWVGPGQNPRMITAFTDGSKQSMELAVTANAFGLLPDKRGMHGPRTTKGTLVEDFQKILSGLGAVDFTLGIDGVNQGGGVFVVGRRQGSRVQEDMKYLKKGKGPDYLFFRDQHLCYFEAPRSIAEAAILNTATIAPAGHFADVLACAKKDLQAGEKLDSLGGFTVYGLIEKASVVRSEKLLPLGLSEFAVMRKPVERDRPVAYSMVDFPEDNLVLKLRRQMEENFTKDVVYVS
ncbi:MAG: Oxidoreductase domain protein [Candidatus Jorgensenbacteria bacterium GW2011_GWA2_45_13]|uniref:Oxidoreductase domain protein n=1 Tax=Candidatus Jorgensenbacteria bacterium GW2011_GWA2_45_13 TaxID=1618662 RepID=A0A0G1L2D4_9BACT|nr:MAG: Oxidoreductase domain protein [Candidatus Jorgensenbacteria bacterium GW2011_GWA2_45_13]